MARLQALQHSLQITDRFIGGGSAGCVYLAYDNNEQEGLYQVACKIVKIPQDPSFDQGRDLRRLCREIEILKHLSHVRYHSSYS